jgi:hypothetical protein
MFLIFVFTEDVQKLLTGSLTNFARIVLNITSNMLKQGTVLIFWKILQTNLNMQLRRAMYHHVMSYR